MKFQSKYKLATYNNGKPLLGEVILELEQLSDTTEHKIIEKYNGDCFRSQGYLESIPSKGYESWKKGIKNGIEYALKMINDHKKYKVTILESNGSTTDTNSIVLAYVASRAILEKIENKESVITLENIKELVYSSWKYDSNSQIDFEKLKIIEN